MKENEVIKIINDFLIDEFELEPEQIKMDTSLREELEIESLDLVDIIVLIEREFGFKVDPQEIIKVTTIRELYDFIIVRVNKP
jgi:acyl carrier protein